MVTNHKFNSAMNCTKKLEMLQNHSTCLFRAPNRTQHSNTTTHNTQHNTTQHNTTQHDARKHNTTSEKASPATVFRGPTVQRPPRRSSHSRAPYSRCKGGSEQIRGQDELWIDCQSWCMFVGMSTAVRETLSYVLCQCAVEGACKEHPT